MSDNNSAAAFGGLSLLAIVLFYLVLLGLIGYTYWRLASKAGYPGAYGLLMFVPCANLVAMIYFVFTEWPIEKELRELRAWANQANASGAYPRPNYPTATPYTPPPIDPGQG